MKMIRPIVNVGKIIDDYEAVIVGFNGVLSDGASIKQEAVESLVEMKKSGNMTPSPSIKDKIFKKFRSYFS